MNDIFSDIQDQLNSLSIYKRPNNVLQTTQRKTALLPKPTYPVRSNKTDATL